MLNLKSILKEIIQTKLQVIIFIFCLILAIGTFISIDSLKDNVESFVERDSKIINGGDVIIDSNKAYSQNLSEGIAQIKENYPNAIFMNSYSFSSVVYSPSTDTSLLSQIRIVSDTYPLYGELELQSEKDIKNTKDIFIEKNNIIVEESLLTRLNVKIGSEIKIGEITFTIVDVILVEPDQPLSLFNLGPRILISEENLEELNLVGEKSRVNYDTLIKTSNEEETLEIVSFLKSKITEREDVSSYFDKDNSLKRFVLNFLFFIKMISLFIIIITGIGMTSIILSYLEDKKLSIGIRKSLGEKNNQILAYYYVTIILISIVGIMFAILFSYLLMNIFPSIFTDILPEDIEVSLSFIAIIKGVVIGLIITTLFTLIPFVSLKKILPIQIFRREEILLLQRDKEFYIVNLLILIFFIIIIFIEIEDLFISFWLVVGSIGLFILLYILTSLILKFLKKLKSKIKNLELRQSLNGLFRIGNKTILVITSITLSLTILFTISFVQLNLQNQFVQSFPENAPNFFVLDVPKDNLSDIEKIIGGEVTFYPVIRGSLLSINGVDVKKAEENKGRGGDSLLRPFSLTYGDLLETEKILETTNKGKIFEDNWDNDEIVQMSILDDVAEMMNVKLGDKVVFLIQGVEIEAQIVSIRTRTQEGINAFFYFTFEEEVLKDAPQTVFTITRVESQSIPLLQNEIVKAFPSVTVINGESTAKTVGEIIGQLSKVVSFFTLFSLGAGILILLSSIVSTNIQRTQEAVFYKLVGASKSFITKVFLFEYLIIGILSSILALLLSSLATFAITTYFLEIDFIFISSKALIYSLSTIIVIGIIGYFSSLNVIRRKPIEYIRENKVE